jgi:hypothetical protein
MEKREFLFSHLDSPSVASVWSANQSTPKRLFKLIRCFATRACVFSIFLTVVAASDLGASLIDSWFFPAAFWLLCSHFLCFSSAARVHEDESDPLLLKGWCNCMSQSLSSDQHHPSSTLDSNLHSSSTGLWWYVSIHMVISSSLTTLNPSSILLPTRIVTWEY